MHDTILRHHRRFAVASLWTLALIACAACAPSSSSPPPKSAVAKASSVEAKVTAPPSNALLPAKAQRRPEVHTYFGVAVTDDYAWLEDPNSPDVKAFIDAENAYSSGMLAGLPGRAELHARLEQLMARPTPSYLAVRRARNANAKGLFVLEQHPPAQQPILVLRNESGALDAVRTIVDPNAIDTTGSTTIDFFVPSPNGKRVAVSLSKGGTERGDIHVFDVATGKETGDVTEHVNGGTAGGSLAWNADGSGYYYTRYPHAGERPAADLDFFQQIYFHKLGTPDEKDAYSLGKDFPRIAEIELEASPDGRFVLAKVANGDGGAFEHHVLDVGASRWKRLSTFDDELASATFGPKNKLYVVSRKGAPRGKVAVFAPPFDSAQDLLAEGEGVVEELVVTPEALYVVELLGGPSRVRRVPLSPKPEPLARELHEASKGKRKGAKPEPAVIVAGPTVPLGARGLASAELPLPPVSSVTAVVPLGEDLLLRSGSYTSPRSWFRYVAREHRLVATALNEPAPADMSDVEVLREHAVSKDGTRVPMTILRKEGSPMSGATPTLLTAYGGYGVSLQPRFRAWYRAFIDAGGAIAEANLRGGGEFGEAWHRAGNLTNKQNVFDDFYACAKRLEALGITNPDKLAITGRSNGGLLMGASLVQHPEAYRAVVSGVGIYDSLRSELSPNGAFNVTEFGTVKDEAQFRAMLAYSPFHNVKDGARYPAVLLTTGANDPRVDPHHSRKMAARLRAASASGRPVLLRASAVGGHGMGSPLAEIIDETTDMFAFLFHELGMTLPSQASASASAK